MTPAKTLSNNRKGAWTGLIPVIRLMIALIVIIEPSSSKWWKQIQRSTAKHWAKLSKSSRREGEAIIWAKGSRPRCGYSLKQLTWANGSSLTPGSQWGNQHRIKLGPLNVGDSCMTGAVCEAVGLGFIPNAWTVFLEPILFGGIPYSA